MTRSVLDLQAARCRCRRESTLCTVRPIHRVCRCMWRWKALPLKSTRVHVRLSSLDAAQKSTDTHEHALHYEKISRLTKYYGVRCGDPVFLFIRKLSRTPMVHESSLRRLGMTVYDYGLWRQATHAPNLDSAIRLMEKRASKLVRPDALQESKVDSVAQPGHPPTWLVLFMICYKVRSAADAQRACSLALHHLPAAPSHLQPPLLMFTAFWLAVHNLLVPLQQLVKKFLDLPTERLGYHFDVLLQSLSHTSALKGASVIAINLMETVSRHNLHLNEKTYTILLTSGLATPELGLTIARQMEKQAFTPSDGHLACLIKLFAKARWQRKAGRCLSVLRQRYAKVNPENILPETASIPTSAVKRTFYAPQNWFMSAFRSTTALNAYLRRISLHEKHRFMRGHAQHSASHFRNVLRVAAFDRIIPADSLVKAIERAKSQIPALRSDVAMYIFAIQGLLYRRDNANAIHLWDEISRYKSKLTTWAVGVGVGALTLGGRGDKAFALLQEIVTSSHADASKTQQKTQWRCKSVDTPTVNIFMVSLQRTGQLDIVFQFWDHMATLFEVRPDKHSLAILLKAARLAGKCDPSFRGALVELGLGRLFGESPSGDVSHQSAHSSLVSMIQGMLSSERHVTMTGLWNGERAGIVALRVLQDIFFGNWPDLATVRSPAHAIRPSASFQAIFPVTDLFRSVMGHSSTSEGSRTGLVPTVSGPLPMYAQIIPNDVVFRAYIDLLAAESLIPRIPLALAWMRHLGVRPSQNTLATALVYWAEVGMDSPMVEHWKSSRSQYDKLMHWLYHWVGPKNMPTHGDVGRAIRRIRFIRELRYSRPVVKNMEGEA
ncbi:hypothetical protein AcV7_010256 [Taiwanofungus camphoratus]|nr:hypothetical protein AcV7_010256 [Antrodia cinnamomea]